MKVIILAAGMGKRLQSLTKNQPKCMVEYKGKRIIDYTLESTKHYNLKNISIVTGYKNKVLEKYINDDNIKFYYNKNYKKTNMVYSLFCAEKEMNDDIIISYGDIIYDKKIFGKLLKSKGDFVVIIDKNWKKLWKIRMKNPLDDAETLKLDKKGYIREIGRTPKSYKDIEAQYVGLIKISKNAIPKVKKYYHRIRKNKKISGKDPLKIDMTGFIQLIIENLMPVKSEKINGGWIEIDTLKDLKSYERSNYIGL